MKNIYFLLIIGVLTAYTSCKFRTANGTNSISSNLSDSLLLEEKPSILYHGSLVFAPESNFLKDCVTKQDWWVLDETEEDIEALYRKMTERPYQEIYAEIKGYLQAPPQEGFASEYDQLLVITELIKLDDLDVDNNCTLTDDVN